MTALVKERYEVLATLGHGGEARIVKALDRQHNRFVALKIRPLRDQVAREDLLGEARVLLTLPPHPALPLVREDFFEGDSYIVAMDWVDGTSLATLLAERGRPGLAPSSVLAYLAQAAEALTHLHSQSPPVIHGDVKPGNLILTKGGRVKLVDFGLSSAPNAPRRRAGTPGYRAPELAAGASPSRASDVYALAATAFALLTGAAPAGLLPSWDGIPATQAEQLEAAIRLGMATDPARRPKTPGELVERLRAGWAAGLPTGVVTFCLSDIEGSAALWDAHPEAMAEALVRHDELIADAVEAHGGSFIKSMGDATISVFDSAPAAVAGALAAGRALAAEAWPGGLDVAVGWGLHTGEAERRDGDFAGPTVSLAARVRAEASGGQILLSPVTSELVAAHLPPGCSLVDLGDLRALQGPGVHAPLGECPYRGLLAFEADDRRFFFGREEVVAEVIGRLAPGRLLAVVGASGSGKSSVLRAGVEATAIITPATELPDLHDGLLVVDQFEELFTQHADANRFIDRLLELRCAVAIAVRADMYGRLGGHRALAQAVAANQVLLGAMTAAELERAITEPARVAGLRLEPGLVELILRDVTAEPGGLPLLSHALRATWERRDGRTLTVAGYRATGGVASAIAQTADAVIDALPEAQRQLAQGVFVRMAERPRVPTAELVPEHVAPATVDGLLDRLAGARLVTLDDGSAALAHEALLREWPRLRRWLDEDRASLRLHRQLGHAARLWDAGGREPSDLSRGARLAAMVELRAELNATERAFLDASVAAAGRERRAQARANRRLRALLAVATLLLCGAITAGVLARRAQTAAESQSLTSDAERVGALALNAPTLEQALLYAAAGVELSDSVETRGDLLAVLQRNPAEIRILRQSERSLPALAVSPDGRLLATGDAAGIVRFTDLATWQPSGAAVRLVLPVTRQAMAFAPDGRTLAVGTGEGSRSELQLVDVATRQARRAGSWPGNVDTLGPTMSLAYSPDGRRLAVSLATMSADLFAPVGERLFMLDGASGRLLWQRRYPLLRDQKEAQVRFGRDGALITSAPQGETLVWNAQTGRVVRRFPIGGRPALSPDGRTLALTLNSPYEGEPSARVGLIDLRTGRHRALESGLPDGWITSLVFTRDGKQIVGTAFAATYVWDLELEKITATLGRERAAEPPSAVVDRRGLVLVASDDGSVNASDLSGVFTIGRRFAPTPKEGVRPSCPAACVIVDPRGALMATSMGDGTVTLTDLRRRRLIHTLPAQGGVAVGMAFMASGRRFVTGTMTETVQIWDVPSQAVVRRLRFSEPVWSVAVSPDDRLLAVQRQAKGRHDAHIEVRDLTSGRTLYTRALPFGVGDHAFTRDGRTLIAAECCTGGSAIRGWDARSGAALFTTSPSEHAWRFALAPDSRTLAFGTFDGRVVVADARTGRRQGPAMKPARGDIDGLAFSPDGRLLAVAAASGTTTLWDVRTRRRVGDTFPVPPGAIPVIAFEPNGRLLIQDLDSTTEWPLDRATLQRFACRVAGRDLTREEWNGLLPNRPYRRVCPHG